MKATPADPVGDQGLDPDLAVGGTEDPDHAAVLDPQPFGVRLVDLDEHVLLQFGQPLVGAGLLAAALVLDQPAGGEDDRVALGDAVAHRLLLDGVADIHDAEVAGVLQVGNSATRSGLGL
jgi:hypothetical protein